MVEPLCPYFGRCGGCTSQHIEYSLQLENKKKSLISQIKFPDVKVFSGSEYGYRNRMDFIFHPGGLGFREKEKWWKIVDIDRCVISGDKINALLSEIRSFFKDAESFDVRKHTGTFRYAVIRLASEASVSFVLNSSSPRLSEAVEKIKEYADKSLAENIIVTYINPDSDVSISSDYFVV
jgi:tRNA (uracil-5-)-methyltransferase